MQRKLKLQVIDRVEELPRLRPLWERLHQAGSYTRFQSYLWNEMAARFFADRQQLAVVAVESGSSAAILPAVLQDGTVKLLGETLFDYRNLLAEGSQVLVESAWQAIGERFGNVNIEVTAVRPQDKANWQAFAFRPFVKTPHILHDRKFEAHLSLERNWETLQKAGCKLKKHDGGQTALIHEIYERKAQQPSGDLFRDPVRVAFLCALMKADHDAFDVWTIRAKDDLVSGLVCFRDGHWRRFYTSCFHPEWAEHSPGTTLLHQASKHYLSHGTDCDLMTGEQPFKLRLANSHSQLWIAEGVLRQRITESYSFDRAA